MPYASLRQIDDILAPLFAAEPRKHLLHLFDTLDMDYVSVRDYADVMLAFAMPELADAPRKLRSVVGDRAYVGDVSHELVRSFNRLPSPDPARPRVSHQAYRMLAYNFGDREPRYLIRRSTDPGESSQTQPSPHTHRETSNCSCARRVV